MFRQNIKCGVLVMWIITVSKVLWLHCSLMWRVKQMNRSGLIKEKKVVGISQRKAHGVKYSRIKLSLQCSVCMCLCECVRTGVIVAGINLHN